MQIFENFNVLYLFRKSGTNGKTPKKHRHIRETSPRVQRKMCKEN